MKLIFYNLLLVPLLTLPEMIIGKNLTLQSAHFKYAMLKTMAQYPEMYEHNCAVISTVMSEALDDISPRFYKAFMSRYTGKSQYCFLKYTGESLCRNSGVVLIQLHVNIPYNGCFEILAS